MFDLPTPRLSLVVLTTIVLHLTNVSDAFAHKGPPYPLLMDKPVAGYVVSVWADPDIGDARFFVAVESDDGQMPSETIRVTMWTEPVSGRLGRVTYDAERQSLRNQTQFVAQPFFDQRDTWNIGFRITSGSGKSQELTARVESTPDGYGPADLVIYLFPFALMGGMWMFAMARRRRLRNSQPTKAGSPSGKAPRDRVSVEHPAQNHS